MEKKSWNKYTLNKSIHINSEETGIVPSPARLLSQLITESQSDFEHIIEILLSFGFLLREGVITKDVCTRLALSRAKAGTVPQQLQRDSQQCVSTAPRSPMGLGKEMCSQEDALSGHPRQQHIPVWWSSALTTRDACGGGTSVHPGMPLGTLNLLSLCFCHYMCLGASHAGAWRSLNIRSSVCFCPEKHYKWLLLALKMFFLYYTEWDNVSCSAELQAEDYTGTSVSVE